MSRCLLLTQAPADGKGISSRFGRRPYADSRLRRCWASALDGLRRRSYCCGHARS